MNSETLESLPNVHQLMHCLHQLTTQNADKENLYDLLKENLRMIIQVFRLSYAQIYLENTDTSPVIIEQGTRINANSALIFQQCQTAEKLSNCFYITDSSTRHAEVKHFLMIPVSTSTKTAAGNLLIDWPHPDKPGEITIYGLELIASHIGNVLQQCEIKSLSSLYKTTSTEENYARKLFMAVLSHDLRSPLTAILTWAQLLKTTSFSSDKLLTGLNLIEESALRQNKIIDYLIHISEVLLNKTPMEFEFTDVNSILNKSLQSLNPLAKNKNIVTNKSLHPHPLIIRADSFRIKQVFSNLLANAIKFSMEEGKLLIKTHHLVLNKKSYAQIIFEDEGIGMKKEQLAKILSLFNEKDSIKAKEGMGIGLALSAYLVKLHSGFMEAHSKGENKGAIFQVMLPLV